MVNLIKRSILFLLFLLGVLGSVNAVYITFPETCAPSNWYVVLNDNTLTTELVELQLNTTDWGYSAPNIVGIDNNIIYFSSKQEMARFCSIVSYSSPTMVLAGAFVPYENGQMLPMTVITTYGSFYSINSRQIGAYLDTVADTSQIAYVYAHSANGDYSQTWVLNNGVEVYYCGYEASNPQFFATTLLSSNRFEHDYRGGGYSSRTSRLRTSLVVFDYVEWNSTPVVVTETVEELYSPPIRGNISIYSDANTEIYEGVGLIGTTDNGGLLDVQLPVGEHTLKFVKDGYWDVYETITVTAENNSEIYVSMAPKNAIFQVSEEFSGNIYPNSISTLSMDITPIKNAYAAKLRISGVDVNKVYYQTHEIPKAADGSYILGDVTSTQNIEIEFKTPSSWGEKAFTVEISATDIEGTAYTNLETINYEVLELPFLLEMPETFGIGTNEITLTDQSGTAYSVLMVLYDSDDVEVWSSSTNLLEYCDYTFEVPVDDAGDYTLELNAKAGTVKTYYSVEIIEPVTLITEEITANPGTVATVQFKISNPTSNVKYYTAELTCPFFNESINKTFSIAPETVDKTVDMSFEVPEELELENYQLTLEIFDPDKTDAIYSGSIVLTISESSLFLASVPGGNTTLILLAAAVLLIVGTFAALRLKK
ncbi:PEGA domain-containing protein [Methanococcus maripaludis]|uniref:PEGA domain-containing protein n=1 Tax=Methanococcus maripaludis TaxID=39152 RepID=UPI00241CDB7D|nr:PEGA domain-containing protein [Methanococcus maripaludis]